jgi:hypothetical protein
MTDDKLKELEKEEDIQQFISLLKEERNSSEAAILPRTCRPYLKKRRNLRLISPYWLLAASIAGFAAGLFTPNSVFDNKLDNDIASIDTVASSGYSIAQMDIDARLLFTM